MDSRYNSFETMDRLFDQMRHNMFGPVDERFDRFGNGVRVERVEDGLAVIADMPGFERDEIDVRLHDDHLVLRAEHEEGNEIGSRSRSISERIALGDHVDPDDVSASYRNGVLEVRLRFEDDSHDGIEIDIQE